MVRQKADEAVAQLVVDINDKQRVLDAIMHLQAIYDDLVVHRDNSASSMMNTKFVSSKVDKVADEVEFTTRQLQDTIIVEAHPYTTVDGYKVYGQMYFNVGTVHTEGFGVAPKPGWEDLMEESNIHKPAIRKVRNYLRCNPPITY